MIGRRASIAGRARAGIVARCACHGTKSVPALPSSPKTGKEAAYEKGETRSFYNAFFRVFGVQRRSVARYEAHVSKLDNRAGFIDLFWPGPSLTLGTKND